MLRQPGALAGRDNGGIERVLDAGLEGCIEKSKVSDLVRSLAFGIQHLAQNELSFGQRARLVGAQDVHAAQILDRLEPAHDDTPQIGRASCRESVCKYV